MYGKGNWCEYIAVITKTVFSIDEEPVMTDEERLAAIAKQYAVLNNRTSGTFCLKSFCNEIFNVQWYTHSLLQTYLENWIR